VVVFMQENRSFDHYFGALKGVRGFSDLNALMQQNGSSIMYQPNGTNYVLPFHITQQCQNDVEHHWWDEHQAWDNGRWDQWVPAKGAGTMVYYTRADLQYYYALAENFTVCDEFHCSVMGPTYPNRLYSMTGTIDPRGISGGPVIDNNPPPNGYTWTTYPERLQAAGVTWKVYQQSSDFFPLNPLAWFANFKNIAPGNPLYDRGLTLVDDLVAAFKADVTNGTLPQVSWIIPTWSSSEHPPYPPVNGAYLTRRLLDALASNPGMYNSTVFILTYDEGGGFFDHVQPPTAPPNTPDEYAYGSPIGLGARVPTLIVSPWTRGGYVCSEVFDHTSVIRFLEKWTGVAEPNISAWRRAVCGDLTSAFNFAAPQYSYPNLPMPVPVGCAGINPTVPTQQVTPTQEPGTNFVRPRPYKSNAYSQTDCSSRRLFITMTNGGTVMTHYSIFANAYRSDGPWQYDVAPHTIVSDGFYVDSSGLYDFTVYGPHSFHRRFAGVISNDCNQLDVLVNSVQDPQHVNLTMQNSTLGPVTFVVTNRDMPNAAWSFTLPAALGFTNVVLALTNSTGSYDLAASSTADLTFFRFFTGDLDPDSNITITNTPPPPPPDTNSLRIALTVLNGNVVLSWPAWAGDANVESRSNVYSGTWAPVGTSSITNGSTVQMVLPLQAGPAYFRLKR